MQYKLIVIKKSVKNMRLRIKDYQTVEVVAPRLMPRFVINRFVRSKKEWIHKHIDKLATVAHELSLKDDELLLYGQKYHLIVDQSCSQTIVDDEKHTIRTNRNLMDANTRQQWYKSYAKKVLTDKITAFADETGIGFHKLFIRSQKTKWGSCSSDKNISLNWKLIQLPEYVIDYVIYHELAHIKHLNHSSRFWKHLDDLYPRVDEAKQWLKKYGIVVQ